MIAVGQFLGRQFVDRFADDILSLLAEEALEGLIAAQKTSLAVLVKDGARDDLDQLAGKMQTVLKCQFALFARADVLDDGPDVFPAIAAG